MNPGDKFSFKCGAKVAEISHPTSRVSTSEDQRASCSSTKSLSHYLACKAEARRDYKPNKPNNKAGFMRKVNDAGSSSKRVVNSRVVINVGLITEKTKKEIWL